MTESLETIRDECRRSQERANERRQRRKRRSVFWTTFWLVLLIFAWVGFGLVVLGVVSF